MSVIRAKYLSLYLCIITPVLAQLDDQVIINFGTHGGDDLPWGEYYVNPSSAQTLQKIDISSGSVSDLSADTIGATQTGDIIELGFFDKLTGGSLTPNTSTSDLFHGKWTPLTSKLTIGQDADSGAGFTVGAGLFSSQLLFDFGDNSLQVNDPSKTVDTYQFLDNVSSLSTYLTEFDNASIDPVIGVRFYDSNSKSSGVRYNTIMNSSWVLPEQGGSVLNMFLYDNADPTSLESGLKFEFDNTTYGVNGTHNAYVGNFASNNVSDATANSLDTDDFVATVTYHDGDDNLDLSDSGLGDVIISGLDGTGDFTAGSNGNQLTIHSNAGNDGNYDFSGNIFTDSSTSTDLTIVKTGTGEQMLSGQVFSLDSDDATASAYLDVAEGTLTLKPGNNKTQAFEYITGAGALKIDNSDYASQTLELGFAESSSASFSGTIELAGTNSESVIKVSNGTDAEDYSREQTLSGVISGSEKLVKSGVGRLKLTGDNTNSGGVDINDGTVAAGHGDALGGSGNAVVINKGKLEVSSGITLANTSIQGGTGKSMIGGAGTFAATITVGDQANEIDYISPGRGISSSLSPSMKGVDLDASTDAIGTLTVGTLNWNDGGVFDWQIKDFNPSGTAGSDWDKLAFTTLNFESSQTFDINIMALKGASFDGTMGLVSNSGNTWTADYATTNGFLFASGTTINGLSDGDVSSSFNIRADDYNYHTGHWYGDWGVHKNGGNLYLTYSVAPEPSTYMMVAGLLMLPGYNFIRRIRKSGSEDKEV